MFPNRLYLTCHGLGPAPASSSADSRRFWLTADVFRRTLELTGDVEKATGIDIRFTFDDGNLSDATIALPLLLAHGRTAKFFVCAERIGAPGYLDAGQLRDLVAAGMTIGCHGYGHLNWCEANDRELDHELRDGRQTIEAAIGRTVDLASAPFGAVDPRVLRAVAAAGFRCLYSSSGGFATADSGLVPRNTLKAGFVPERDLFRMARLRHRAWDGLYDTARRVKYRFF